jgi:predicted dehydrogenase
MHSVTIGFLGAGGIARAHAYSLQALKYYYENIPEMDFVSVASLHKESREDFARKYSFHCAESVEVFSANNQINTVFILGPNNTHFGHLKLALEMPSVTNIYLEKPVCASEEEEQKMRDLLSSAGTQFNIQVGFQYLQTASVREVLKLWRSGIFGKPVHFDLNYYHGDYLQASYREKRKSRLTPAPDGGAMADLGSHGFSLLVAFFNEDLRILHAFQAGSFDDVPAGSDLFGSVVLYDPHTGAAGNLSASRISSGSGDLIRLELYAEKGALRYSSRNADSFEYYLEEKGCWTRQPVGSHYQPVTSFPSGHVPPGWLRALVHAHYLFLTGDSRNSFVPGLQHGLAVQRLVRETADHLEAFRKKVP